MCARRIAVVLLECISHRAGDFRIERRSGVIVEVDVFQVSVSRMRMATTIPEMKVRTATAAIAADSPSASATMPDSIAPIAYPRSRHRRYTPIAEARHDGCATSLIAARRVG